MSECCYTCFYTLKDASIGFHLFIRRRRVGLHKTQTITRRYPLHYQHIGSVISRLMDVGQVLFTVQHSPVLTAKNTATLYIYNVQAH